MSNLGSTGELAVLLIDEPVLMISSYAQQDKGEMDAPVV